MQTPAANLYEFGDFQLDSAKRVLRRVDGTPVPLTPRVFDTLLYMVEHHDSVLDKERIMEAVWPDSIVEENNLAQAISKLRQVFGETPGSHSYIVTVPGRGYRFVAEVIERTAIAETAEHRRTKLARQGIGNGLSAPSQIPEKSIAVLPFENRSRDPENAFFADGVQDEILTNLARIADLKVISRTSVMQYKRGVNRSLRQIANELGVANVVEGSVQRAGNRVRVNAQLIDARSDAHLWAQTYDRDLADVFAIQSEIAKAIADQLQAKLTGSERKAMGSNPTENPEAYELYLRGRFFCNKRTAPDLRKSIDLFKEAVAKDPQYALAYAAMAQSWLLLPAYEDCVPKDCFIEAQAAAEKALALDPSVSDAHAALAAVKLLYNFDPLGAIAEFEQAIKLNPNDATAHHWLGNHALVAIGDLDRGLAEVRRAQELDPLSLVINTNVGWGLLIEGRYDEAIAQLRKTIEMDESFYYARYTLGEALQLSGRIVEAEKEYKKAAELTTDPFPLACLAHLYGTNGRQEEAAKILSQLLETRKRRYVDAYCLAIAYLGLSDRAEAMNWLEQSYRDRNGYELDSLRVDPFLAPLREDPRFEALAEKIVPAREFKGAVIAK